MDCLYANVIKMCKRVNILKVQFGLLITQRSSPTTLMYACLYTRIYNYNNMEVNCYLYHCLGTFAIREIILKMYTTNNYLP